MAIANFADKAVAISGSGTAFQDHRGIKRYRHSQIDLDLAYRITQICQLEVQVTGSVDDNDSLASAHDHFIESQVFKVPAIGKIDPLVFVGGLAQGFIQQRRQRESGARISPNGFSVRARIGQPP